MKLRFIDDSETKGIPADFEDGDKYESVEIENAPLDDRTQARGVALQILYERDLTDHPLGAIIRERMETVDLDNDLAKFVIQIVAGTIPNTAMIDSFTVWYAPEWPIDQIAVIDRNIIRMAVWEFAIAELNPVKVVINESIELAKYFGSLSSKRFVHGVLGSLSGHIDEIKAAAKLPEED